MGYVLVYGTRCEEMQCITCGVSYTVPCVVADHQRKHGGYHHCPNGHSQGWGKGNTEFDRIRQERDLLKQNEARLEDELRAAQKKAEKVAKRVAAGVCPCCTRTFSNMARHMKTKHPDYNVVPLKAIKA